MKSLHLPTFFAVLLWGGFSYLLFILDKLENLPTFSVAFMALGFSYFAHIFAKEKFRLDLLERRLNYYNDLVAFFSLSDYTTLRADAHSKRCLIGKGFAKARFLFGPEIVGFVIKINNARLQLKEYSATDLNLLSNEEEKQLIRESCENINFLQQGALNESIKLFEKYIYFGNHFSNLK